MGSESEYCHCTEGQMRKANLVPKCWHLKGTNDTKAEIVLERAEESQREWVLKEENTHWSNDEI